jgi:hypothetical protein
MHISEFLILLYHHLHLNIFIDLIDSFPLSFRIKRSLIHLINVVVLLLHFYNHNVIVGSKSFLVGFFLPIFFPSLLHSIILKFKKWGFE